MVLNPKTQNNNVNEDDAAIYVSNPLTGVSQQKVVGNRIKNRPSLFLRYWSYFVNIPANPSAILCDAGLWVFATSLNTFLVKYLLSVVGYYSLVAALPLACIIIALIVVNFIADTKLMSIMVTIRLLLIALGVLISL